MQMGFEAYLDLLYNHQGLFWELMEKNQAFAIEYANAQLEAGATAIGYFDPLSSPTIIGREKFIETGFPIMKQTLAALKGPGVVHFASGRCLQILDKVMETPAVGVGVSSLEDLTALKEKCRGRLTLLGNLDGISMRRWTTAEADRQVRTAVMKAGQGGGFILADNHGEIPYQVTDEVLHAIQRGVVRWGQYPLKGA